MQKLTKSLKWLDENLVKVMTVIFIFLIPLYPKFPLQILRDTYIAIRLDDIFMALYFVAFGIQWLRGKITPNFRLLPLFVLFWIFVFVSFLWGTFMIPDNIIFPYVGLLHAARRIEYMAVFFIAASSVRNKEDFIFYLKCVTATAALVFLYGIGQKFIGLPAVQTMNKEFAKGLVLYLDEYARVSSTFAGHYDLAAYVVLLVPVMLSLHMRKLQHWIFATTILAITILVMTASRSSFGAYVVATFAFLLFTRKWKYLIAVTAITAVLMVATGTLTERFASTFRVKTLFVDKNTGSLLAPQNISIDTLPVGTTMVGSGKTTDKEASLAAALLQKQLLESIRKEASRAGETLTQEQEAALLNQALGNYAPVVGYAADISFTTRLEVEWPRAVNAFMRNPLLGTGPSSITESSDNSFFRWLGEFGILGTSMYFAILMSIVILIWKSIGKMARENRILFHGFVFGLLGLAINGTYIDVFEASKVAYTLWLLAGITVGALPYYVDAAAAKKAEQKKDKTK